MATDTGYVPGASQRSNDQVKTYEATDGAQAGKFVAEVKRWLEAVDTSTAIW